MVTPPEDTELLARYARHGDEAAFAELVRRHLGIVYHAALRRMGGDAHMAEDVAQAVFCRLARKAAALAGHQALAGWLHTTTRHVASETQRAERRRRAREQEAFNMWGISTHNRGEAADWERLRPVIDDALGELDERDREAVLLRYFAGLSHADVGARLALSENAARMRAERALDRLHALLARRGVTSTAAALGATLASQAGAAVPAGLAGSVTSGALASGATVATGAAAVFGTISIMKMTLTAGGVALLCTLLGTAGWQTVRSRATETEAEAARAETAALAVRNETARRRAEAADREARDWSDKLAAAKAERLRTTATPPPVVKSAPGTNPDWDPVREGEALMRRHPDLRRAVVEREDAITNFTYGSMFRELGFTAEKEEAFRALMREARGISAPFGPRGEVYVMSAGTGMGEVDIEPRLRALLGEEWYARLPEFRRRSEARGLTAKLAATLAFSEAPLTSEQARGIADLVLDTTRTQSGTTGNFDWDTIATRARATLSPPQMEALKAMRTTQERQRAGALGKSAKGGPGK